jgi:hypothetical protein
LAATPADKEAMQVDEVKKTYREGEETAKETWRKSDGEEDVADKVGNVGDDVRKGLGNLGDELNPDDTPEERPVDTATQPR